MSGNPNWTKTELNLLEQLWPHHTAREITKEMGRSISGIKCKALQLGLRKQLSRSEGIRRYYKEHRHSSRIPLPKQEVVKLNASGHTLSEIGEKYDCDAETIRNRLKEWGILGRGSGPRWKLPSISIPSEKIIAYVSGLLDGDGSIGRESITISNTCRAALKFIAQHIGGHILNGSQSNLSTKPIFQWTLSVAADRLVFLELLYPYLIIKRKEAKQALMALRENLPTWLLERTHSRYQHMLPAGFM